MHPTQLQAHLAQFTGSETFTRHGLARSVLMTEGVVFLAQHAHAHWLTDAIASYLHDPRAKREEFQVWQLSVDTSTRRAVLSMTDGNSTKPIITQSLDHTDFPLDAITLWLVASGNHRVLMLPSEY
jgi:hypothetical protein